MSEIPDNIWSLVQEGDRKSFENIYHAFYKPLCFYAHQITKNHELSEELVNDFFLKIWTNREFLLIRGSVKNYLFQSIHNSSLNLVKSMSSNKANLVCKVPESHWKFIEETYIINDFLLENIVAGETENKIKQVIACLPDQCREIFNLSRFQYKSNQEISNLLKITENTVRVQLFRAIYKIKEALSNYK